MPMQQSLNDVLVCAVGANIFTPTCACLIGCHARHHVKGEGCIWPLWPFPEYLCIIEFSTGTEI